jgi:hypothetical protein
MNSCGEAVRVRGQPERAKSVRVFRHLFCSGPDVISGQIDVLPAERGEVSQQMVRDILNLAQGGDGAFQVTRVPQDNGGNEQIEDRRRDAADSRRFGRGFLPVDG